MSVDLEALLEELARLRRSPGDVVDVEPLRRAFASRSPYAVSRAATLIGERRVAGFVPELLAAYERGFTARDPGALQKTATAEALDLLEHDDAAPFERGVDHVQREGGGPPTDVATGLRARCLFALVRLRVPDAVTRAADRLADDEPTVRSAAAQALAYHGDERAAPLLRLKLRLGDPEPDVVTDVLKAYLALEPDAALPLAAGLLRADREVDRMGAALALGESRRAEALTPLLDYASTAVQDAELRTALYALAALRQGEADAQLFELVAAGDERRAPWALRALARPGADETHAANLARAAARNPHVDLAPLLAELFPDAG